MGRAFEYRKAAKLKRWGHMAKTFTNRHSRKGRRTGTRKQSYVAFDYCDLQA